MIARTGESQMDETATDLSPADACAHCVVMDSSRNALFF